MGLIFSDYPMKNNPPKGGKLITRSGDVLIWLILLKTTCLGGAIPPLWGIALITAA